MNFLEDIKFKFWLGHTKKMTYAHSLIEISHLFWDFTEDIIALQYIGLKDKNGVEIYKGDIVRILYTDWDSKLESDERTLQQYLIDIATIGVVEFNEDRFCVKTKSKKYSDFNYSSIFAGKHGYIEIIGNIFENPELLKQEHNE